MEFQPALVAASTILVLVVSLLVSTENPLSSAQCFSSCFQGITYSVMSASWDEDREGDFLGAEEFSKNVQNIKDGLGRSRENAMLRDKMSGLGQDELNRAMSDLEKREALQQRKSQSLRDKINEEMDE